MSNRPRDRRDIAMAVPQDALVKRAVGSILEHFMSFWEHLRAFGSILEHFKTFLEHLGSLQGRLGHIAYRRLEEVTYRLSRCVCNSGRYCRFYSTFNVNFKYWSRYWSEANFLISSSPTAQYCTWRAWHWFYSIVLGYTCPDCKVLYLEISALTLEYCTWIFPSYLYSISSGDLCSNFTAMYLDISVLSFRVQYCILIALPWLYSIAYRVLCPDCTILYL